MGSFRKKAWSLQKNKIQQNRNGVASFCVSDLISHCFNTSKGFVWKEDWLYTKDKTTNWFDGKAVWSNCLTLNWADNFINSWVNISEIDYNKAFTIGFRLKSALTTWTQTLFCQQRWTGVYDWLLIRQTTSWGKVEFILKGIDWWLIKKEFTSLIDDTNWHHYRITYDWLQNASWVKIYVDSIEDIATNVVSDNLTASASGWTNFFIASARGSSAFLNWQIVWCSLYSVVKGDEIRTSFDTLNCLLYYKLTYWYWLIAFDSSENGNHWIINWTWTDATFWGNKQNVYHGNIIDGFTENMLFGWNIISNAGLNWSSYSVDNNFTIGIDLNIFEFVPNSDSGGIIRLSNSFWIRTQSSWRFVFFAYDTWYKSIQVYGSDVFEWNNVVCRISGSKMEIFLNWVSVASRNDLWTLNSPTSWTLQLWYQDPSRAVNWLMKDLRLYNTDLTDQQILDRATWIDISTINLMWRRKFDEISWNTLYNAITGENFVFTAWVYFNKIPSKNSIVDVFEKTLSNPSWTRHNGAETKFTRSNAFTELVTADSGIDFFYTAWVSNEIWFDEMVANVQNEDIFFFNTVSLKKTQNMYAFQNPKTGICLDFVVSLIIIWAYIIASSEGEIFFDSDWKFLGLS